MSPEVFNRKRELLIKYLEDFKIYKDIDFDGFLKVHYTVERLFELLVTVCCDIILHLLSSKNEEIPTTYRTIFLRAGELDIIEKDLAHRFAKAAGMRNIIVHGYEEIDYNIIHKSINQMIEDVNHFLIQVDDHIQKND